MNTKEPLSRTEIFKRVREHLLTQNERAEDDYGCRYRMPDGKRCAIGCLIPDSLYSTEYEHEGIDSLPFVLLEYLGGLYNEDFLQDLQNVHDGYTPESWPIELDRVAHEYGLIPETPNPSGDE